MSRLHVVPVLLVLAVAGCQSSVDGTPSADPAVTGAAATAPTSSPDDPSDPSASSEPEQSDPPESPPAEDGTDLAACADADCTVEVTAPVVLPVDPRFGVAELRVTAIDADVVTVEGSGPGIGLSSTIPPGSTSVLNGIELHVVSIDDGTAVLQLSPA